MEENIIDLKEFNMSDEELFSVIEHDDKDSEKIIAPRYSYWKSVIRVFFRKKINIILLALLGVLILFTYIYPIFSNYDEFAYVMQDPNNPTTYLYPSEAIAAHASDEVNSFFLHWILGTGNNGQSVFDAIWNGSRISVSLAFLCAAINMTVGVIIGAIWGFSKKVDMIMTEVYNIIGNVPYILLISVVVMVMSASFMAMVFALTITGWLGIAYFIRTQVIIIRDREYNLASRCLGTPIVKLTMRNILPFMTSIIVTLLATEIPSYISYEVFLSYIGMGLTETSLGKLIQYAEGGMFIDRRMLSFWAPVAVSAIISIVLYVVGQNLGDASDPRTHM
ncbi:MAG: ABC transporter permease [Clostridia bacterium]|nr:ABC transporter permease [Clostridia bacterium]